MSGALADFAGMDMNRRELVAGLAGITLMGAHRFAAAQEPRLVTVSRRTLEVKGKAATVFGLTGPDAQIRRLTDQLDASYEKQKPDPESGAYSVAHTSFIYLFDVQGKWSMTYPFQSPAEAIAKDLRQMLVSP